MGMIIVIEGKGPVDVPQDIAAAGGETLEGWVKDQQKAANEPKAEPVADAEKTPPKRTRGKGGSE